MPLTPDEVAAKSFPSVLRGYAKWEVDEFLKDVALDYQRALGLAEWAMQRSSSVPVAAPTPTAPTVATTPEPAEHLATSTCATTTVRTAAGESATTQPQIDRLGEHIRYLAILVNSMSQRIDQLESRLAARPSAAPPYPDPIAATVPSPPTAASADAPAPTNGVAFAPPAESQASPIVAAKDWWPSESPLWVVTQAKTQTPNPYGPRA